MRAILTRNGLILLMFFSSAALARELTLEQVWREIAATSKVQQASELRVQAAAVGKVRATRHWLPQVYVDAKSYETNDPGLSFLGTLSERSVTTDDFAPNNLNHPGNHLYTRGAVGLDWPLYEGGMKVAQVAMNEHVLASTCSEMKHIKTMQYVEVAKLYGSLQGLEDQKLKLSHMQKKLGQLLESYQVGEESNPLGYSGLLGLKNLTNRIQGLLTENRAKELANKDALKEMGLKEHAWSPTKSSVVTFIDRYFPSPAAGVSPKIIGQKQIALAQKSRVAVENAKYLPKVGAYAEEYLFNGDRSTASGYTVGMYLRWNMLNPADYGVAKEAQLNAMAADLQAGAAAEQDRAESHGLSETILAIRSTLDLMEYSDKLLREQTTVSQKLFQRGAMNALQLTEILARHVDLIANHTDAELMLLQLYAQRATKTNFNLPIL